MHDLPLDQDLARVRLDHPGDAVDEGGLPGAVVAEEAEDLAVLELDGNIDERVHAAVGLRQQPRVSSAGGFRPAKPAPPLPGSSVELRSCRLLPSRLQVGGHGEDQHAADDDPLPEDRHLRQDSAFCTSEMKMTPRNAPGIGRRRRSGSPPRTTAVITFSSTPIPAVTTALSSLEASKTPASPARPHQHETEEGSAGRRGRRRVQPRRDCRRCRRSGGRSVCG